MTLKDRDHTPVGTGLGSVPRVFWLWEEVIIGDALILATI